MFEVVFHEGLLFLAVRNIGSRPARGVSVTFDRPVFGLGGTCEVSALPVFRNIEFLGPGREIRALLDSSASYFRRGEPQRISVHVAYRDVRGRRRAATMAHDLGIYKTLPYVGGMPESSEGG